MSITLEQRKHVAVLTLDNPQTLNALNRHLIAEINAKVDEVTANPDIYVLVITGRDKAFIAGADIKEMIDLSAVETLEWAQLGSQLNDKLEHLRLPVIAAINGFALGGGLELAMSCDIRIASDKAKLGLPETGLGVTPGAGGTQRLPRIVGTAKAKEMLFTAKMITAQEAEKIGLVNRVVPHEVLMEETMKMAEEISRNGQIAIQQCKRAVNAGIQIDENSAMALELQIFSLCGATEDKQVGMGAFIRKEVTVK
jgi:enoyl-CoA hydratase